MIIAMAVFVYFGIVKDALAGYLIFYYEYSVTLHVYCYMCVKNDW